MAFQEYPKVMKHPQNAPAVWTKLKGTPAYEAAVAAGKTSPNGLFAPDTVCTQPERFPQVTVTNIDQEKQYAARGYRPTNNPDPVAYEQSMLDIQPNNPAKLAPYPKWKYHAIELPVIVKSAEEEQALGKGWADAPVIATEDDLPLDASSGSSTSNEGEKPEARVATGKPTKAKGKKVKGVKARRMREGAPA